MLYVNLTFALSLAHNLCQFVKNLHSVVLHSFWVKCSLVPLSFFNMSRSLSTREVRLGFSIEAGTRRLITTYFGICSRLLCILFAAFLFFV